jgi:hypothetical protein
MLLRDVTVVCIQNRMKPTSHGTVRKKKEFFNLQVNCIIVLSRDINYRLLFMVVSYGCPCI